MKFLRLSRTEWAGLAVLVMAAWYGTQWLTARDLRVSGDASFAKQMQNQERKLDALFTWADLVSQLNGWPRPRIPERPIALPDAPADRVGTGPYAAQLDEQNEGGCP